VIRGKLIALSIGMVVLWAVGLAGTGNSTAVAWLDLVAAVLGFMGASSITYTTPRGTVSGGTIALSLGIFGIFIGSLVNAVPSWQTWWNFGFACAYLILGIYAGTKTVGVKAPQSDQTTPRRVA
jgi:hypothetical protein